MRARHGWGQPPTAWPQPHLPGWTPLMDPGPLPLQAARSVGRWLWPTLAVSGFLAVVAYAFAHDHPAPGLSHRGLLTVALAAAVVVLLTIHRRYGPGSLARALAEYALVALLAALLAGAGIDQQPAANAAPARSGQAQAMPDANPQPKPDAAAGDDRPAVIRVGARVVRAVTGAVGWLVDLWRQADQQAQPPTGEALAAAAPLSSAPPARSTWRSP